MSRRRIQVSSQIRGSSFCQFLERYGSEQYAITFNQSQVGCDDDFRFSE